MSVMFVYICIFQDFHGYTPMEQEMCRAKKRRGLVTQTDTDWESHHEACAAVRSEISQAATPGKIRVRKRSDQPKPFEHKREAYSESEVM